jgi:hypothetical protein
MVGAIILAFLCGVALGVWLGRRQPREATPEAAAAPVARPLARPAAPRAAPMSAPTEKGRKAGLTEESFTPSDDILEKLRLAAEGQLDPSDLGTSPPEPAPPPAPRPSPSITEAEQRVLDRLRQRAQEADPGDGSPSSLA